MSDFPRIEQHFEGGLTRIPELPRGAKLQQHSSNRGPLELFQQLSQHPRIALLDQDAASCNSLGLYMDSTSITSSLYLQGDISRLIDKPGMPCLIKAL